ncbi:alginate export family protein [Vineibacter terrae]|uniref:alginate export family protein n=1 Tax=Vineibacter terrae TaxID=2586908 RepID=UPI0015B56AC7|nr:alginate export family protein [Vineibacter terrae]
MGKLWIIGVVSAAFTLWSPSLRAQDDGETPFLPKTLRYDEDYRYLADPARRGDPWDPLKHIPLNGAGDVYLSLGGELRERYEHTRNLGVRGKDDVLMNRLLLSADLHVGDAFRSFVQFGVLSQFGRDGGSLATDENRLDFQQAFFDASTGLGPTERATLRVGRQEMNYGSGRFVSIREGPNARRSFDGFRALYRAGGMDIDAFVTRPVQLLPGTFDDRPDKKQGFWGAYAVARLPAGMNLDVYYFGLDRANAVFAAGIADERRHTLGTRLWGASGAFDYNVEAAFQFGSFGSQTIRAWGVSADLGVTFATLPFKPRLGLKANAESGDGNPQDRRLGTLNPLFPNHAYFSEAAVGAPMNDIDFQPNLTLQLAQRLSFYVGWDFFWRQSTRDAVYNAALLPIPGTAQNNSRYIGDLITTHLRWRVDRHLEVNLDYTHFFAGGALRKAGRGDIDFAMMSVAYRF